MAAPQLSRLHFTDFSLTILFVVYMFSYLVKSERLLFDTDCGTFLFQASSLSALTDTGYYISERLEQNEARVSLQFDQ